jgi:hypothetical protein
MGVTRNIQNGSDKCTENICRYISWKGKYLDINVDWRIILKLIREVRFVKLETEFKCFRLQFLS